MDAASPTALKENVRRAPAGPSNPDARPPRFYELDVLRFVAASAVLAFHYCFRAGAQNPVMADTGFTDPHHIFRYGYLGVDLFFVISGFVILNSAWHKPASAFVASRVARLYPAFWAACTLSALVVALDPNRRFDVSVDKWLVNLTMTPTLFDVGQVDGVYWTLLVELKFYLVVLALCLVGMTTNRILGFAVGWLALSMWHAVSPLPNALAQLLVPEWSAYFVAGICFALISRDGWRTRYVLTLLAAFAWSVHLAVEFAAAASAQYRGDLSSFVVGGVIVAIFAVFALLAAHKLRIRWAARLAFLGALTYPLYLLHQNIGFILFALWHDALPRWPRLIAVLTVVVGLAWLLHVAVERRFASSLARWIRGRLKRLTVAVVGIQHVEEAQRARWAAMSLTPACVPTRVL